MSKKCTPLWREAHFEVKMHKTHQLRTTFGSWDVEKVHAVVARSTFRSQNAQSTPLSDHFWKLRCRKSARRCGAKNISKWKCTQHTSFGPLLEVEMSKKCTPLWREEHFEVKMYKTHYMFAPLLEVQMSKKCTPLWREAHFEVKMHKTLGVRTTFGGSDVASPLRFTTLHYVTLHHTPLYYTTLHYTTLHNTTTTTTQLDYTPLHSTTLNFTTLRSTTLHDIKLHYTPLHHITPHYAPQHYNYNYVIWHVDNTWLCTHDMPWYPQYESPRITVRDCGPLFDILAGDDGLITISEFCRGIMQLKGTARALDIVVLQHENSKLMSECSLDPHMLCMFKANHHISINANI